jgi:hypothetical protein
VIPGSLHALNLRVECNWSTVTFCCSFARKIAGAGKIKNITAGNDSTVHDEYLDYTLVDEDLCNAYRSLTNTYTNSKVSPPVSFNMPATLSVPTTLSSFNASHFENNILTLPTPVPFPPHSEFNPNISTSSP